MSVETVWMHCHGPAIQADAEKCMSKAADAAGGHMVPKSGDAKPYNGIRQWRCPECFAEHRRRVRQAREGMGLKLKCLNCKKPFSKDAIVRMARSMGKTHTNNALLKHGMFCSQACADAYCKQEHLTKDPEGFHAFHGLEPEQAEDGRK